jgi:hypothetical protein
MKIPLMMGFSRPHLVASVNRARHRGSARGLLAWPTQRVGVQNYVSGHRAGPRRRSDRHETYRRAAYCDPPANRTTTKMPNTAQRTITPMAKVCNAH